MVWPDLSTPPAHATVPAEARSPAANPARFIACLAFFSKARGGAGFRQLLEQAGDAIARHLSPSCITCRKRGLFQLDRAGGFGRAVVEDPVDPRHLLDDPRRGLAQEIMGKGVIVRRHPVHAGHRAQGQRVVIGPPVAHHAHRLHRQDRGEGLPDLVVKPVLADLVDIDRIGAAQDVQLFRW